LVPRQVPVQTGRSRLARRDRAPWRAV